MSWAPLIRCYQRLLLGSLRTYDGYSAARVLRILPCVLVGHSPFVELLIPGHVAVEDSSMWSSQTIPVLDCYPVGHDVGVRCTYIGIMGTMVGDVTGIFLV